MTLPFMTHFPAGLKGIGGKETKFVERIWSGFDNEYITEHFIDYSENLNEKGYLFDLHGIFNEKFHTIRTDPHNRWKPGTKIHMVLWNRTAKRFQFVPVLEVKSVQEIYIVSTDLLAVQINNEKWLTAGEIHLLAQNDGFDSVDDFYAYFNKSFEGKIIHWTDLTY